MMLKTLMTLLLTGFLFTHGNATQTDIAGPGASGTFGETVVVLPNGNFVVVDRQFDEGGVMNIGAVYMYDGATLAVISTLKGSALEDQVGNGGITVLTNGNFVVSSTIWDNGAALDAGAVTWCSATTGCNGTVSDTNSLVGDQTVDNVGSGGVTALTNGNYVVSSPNFDKPAIADVGAVTWGNGAGGTVGTVAALNSLVGGAMNDFVGRGGVTALTNGNYVVKSSDWDNPSLAANNDAGAVTWGNGAGGTVNLVTDVNSLVGDQIDDNVGSNGVTALTNGNYVVSSPNFDKPLKANVGAVTWGNGGGGTVDTVSASNSLVGGSTDDGVGGGGGGATALTNGNYVVRSPLWDNPATPGANDQGAATWGNGAGGTVGLVTSANSLVGGANVGGVQGGEKVGSGGVTALTNGNYVVSSPNWINPSPLIDNVGAATWGNGTGGTVDLVTSANSLIGGSTNDFVGSGGVTALTNGNYVVNSPSWDNPSGPITAVGAATWGNGAGGTVDLVTTSNSLFGGTSGDQVGSDGVTALINGNYVVSSQFWAGFDFGAATWGNGAGGTVGLVSSANSLVGGIASDNVGSGGATALLNGNYVVNSPLWNNPSPLTTDVGAVTWGNGAGLTVGPVTTSNSLVGGSTDDVVGSGGVTALTSGNYVVYSNSWDNPTGPIPTAKAVSFGNGTGGTVGLLTSANSVLGTVTNDITGSFSYDAMRNRLFVGRETRNIVSILFFNTTAIADGNINNPANWDNGVPNALVNTNIPTGRSITVNTASTIGSLDIANGATLTMNANLNLTGSLTRGNQINAGANTLGLSCSTIVFAAAADNFVIGNVKKDFCATGIRFSYPTSFGGYSGGAATGAFTYPVGTTTNGNEFSPLAITVTALGRNRPSVTNVPSSLTVAVSYGTAAPLNDATSLDRYWTLTESGALNADLVFNYMQTDVDGNEANYRLIRVEGGIATHFPEICPTGSCVGEGTNTITVNDVTSFSDWTAGEPVAPTAADSTVSGTITDANGNPVEGAAVRMNGTQYRLTVTDALGRYRFADVETNGIYTLTPSRANFLFSPAERSFSQLGNNTEAAFTALLDGSHTNPIDTAEYFVRQHYLDFLGREPDESGLNFWSDQILGCGNDFNCLERRTINVSAAYFLSIEFQETGGLVDGLYLASYGRAPLYNEFMPDTATVAHNVIVGNTGWEQELATNKQEFLDAWVQRAAFRAAYDNFANDGYVDTLISNTGVNFTDGERNALLGGLTDGTLSRAQVLQRVAQNERFVKAKFNEAFVRMQYFGYLRRDPDDSGFHFWLNKLNEFDGNFEQAEMVKAFIVSGEYRDRFPR